jgi:hypothetical protein
VAKKIFITFEEAVDELGVNGEQLQTWMRSGQIRAFRFHKTVSYKRAEIEALRGSIPDSNAESVVPSEPPDEKSEPSSTNLGIADVVGDIPEQNLQVPSLKDLKVLSLTDLEEDELTLPLSEFLSKPPAGDDDEETFLEPLVDGKPKIESPRTPEAPPDSEIIRFHCDCGKRLKSNSEYIGKAVLCPRCNKKLKVPSTSEPRREITAPQGHPALLKLLAKFKKLKGEVREISAKFADLEQTPEGDVDRGLISRMGTLERQTQGIASELEALRKENQQIQFDIARLQDLMTRLQPEADVMLTGPAPLSDSSDDDTWHDE